MRFKQFIRLNEIGEIEGEDVSHITFLPDNVYGGVRHEFNIDGRLYKVYFVPYNLRVSGQTLSERSVSITFSGPNGVDLTNFGNSHAVYTEMLKGIKKYLEEHQPEGLHFYGATGSMDLMYATFVKRFLSDREGKDPRYVYYRIGDMDYIRKDIYQKLPPEEKSNVDYYISRWQSREADFMKTRKETKYKQRSLLQKLANSIGGFYMINPMCYGLIYNVTSSGIKMVVVELPDRHYFQNPQPYLYDSGRYLNDLEADKIIERHNWSVIGMDKLTKLLEALFDPKNSYASSEVPKEIMADLQRVYAKISPHQARAVNPPKPTASFGQAASGAAQSPMRGPGRPQRDLLDRYRQYSAGDLARGEFDEV